MNGLAPCAQAIPWERLVGYWFDQPDEALEEHTFTCDACTARLEHLAGLAAAVRRRAHAGALRGAVTAAMLDRLRDAGLGVRRYELEPSGQVQCSAGPADDLVVAVLRVPGPALAAARVDALFHSGDLVLDERLEDVPVAADGAVHWVLPGAFVRTLPDHVLEIRLVEPAPGGDRELVRYTLHHSASGG